MPSMRLLAPMTARDPEEAHRAATPLELFFDLTFVVAIAQLANGMHHELVDGDAGHAVIAYPIVFFAIWWAWMNFTWFASAYDTDDAAYRIAALVQMFGALVLAAGLPEFLEGGVVSGTALLGYVIMRIGLVAQWTRAAIQHPDSRPCAARYAVGVFACEVGWVVLFFVADGWWMWGAIVGAVCEMAVPAWAERHVRTGWHPRHIAERYGLFTIIVLGESVLASTVALQVALDAGEQVGDLATIAVGGMLLVSTMWWIYFDMPIDRVLDRARHAFSGRDRWQAFVWGYGHFVVFGSAAAVGVGVAVAVDQVTHHSTLTDLEAGLTVTVPVAVYLMSVWALHVRYKERGRWRCSAPTAAALILAMSWTPEPVLLSGIVTASLLAISLIRPHVTQPVPELAELATD